ncbi:MAG: amino acid ABC transporter permease [Tuberibacillus sp.]
MTWHDLFKPHLAIESVPYILQGIWDTLLISILSMIFGLALSVILAVMRSSHIILFRWPARVYISFMRGMPMIVFLFLLYFGLPVAGVEWNALTAAIVGFSLNSAAYMAEINRAAITSVPKDQWDAAMVFGASYRTALMAVILPQAFRMAIPSLGNVFLDLIKSSSLAAVISVPEMFHQSQIVAGRTLDSLTMYFLVAIIYWLVCLLASALQNYLEKRFPILN